MRILKIVPVLAIFTLYSTLNVGVESGKLGAKSNGDHRESYIHHQFELLKKAHGQFSSCKLQHIDLLNITPEQVEKAAKEALEAMEEQFKSHEETLKNVKAGIEKNWAGFKNKVINAKWNNLSEQCPWIVGEPVVQNKLDQDKGKKWMTHFETILYPNHANHFQNLIEKVAAIIKYGAAKKFDSAYEALTEDGKLSELIKTCDKLTKSLDQLIQEIQKDPKFHTSEILKVHSEFFELFRDIIDDHYHSLSKDVKSVLKEANEILGKLNGDGPKKVEYNTFSEVKKAIDVELKREHKTKHKELIEKLAWTKEHLNNLEGLNDVSTKLKEISLKKIIQKHMEELKSGKHATH